VYQQLNRSRSDYFRRFAALAGEALTPEGILKLQTRRCAAWAYSKQKSAYLKDLAAKTHGGDTGFAKAGQCVR